MPKKTPRYLAVEILTTITKQKSYSNLALDQVIKKEHLNPQDAGFLTQLVYGVIQHEYNLDYYLKPFIQKPTKMAVWVRQVLRTAVYQLVYLDRVPEHAIFYEATEIAKQMGHVGTAKLVTAILRNLQRTGLADLNQIESPLERLSITYSVPEWLVEKLQADLGIEKVTQLLTTINQPANASIRVNTRLNSVADLLPQLQEQFENLVPSQIASVGLVAQGGHLASGPAFEAGSYTIQDESSMLVAPSLQIQPTDQVLDACAAPGGKSTHMATYLDAKQGGRLVALDIHDHKVRLIEQNAKRLHVEDVIEAQALDARKISTKFAAETFDKILVDAPCSGLGLMRRKPEIKYSRQPADLINLQKIQIALLNAVAPTLKVGGQLTYSTCTIVPEENQQVITAFLAQHPEFTVVPVPLELPLTQNQATPFVQIYPDDYQTDGFFIACLQRKA